ncbi:MAG: ribonucleoside triphosphate reductase [Lachnospiraceae bacterium]|jgi:ribonucleoside-triphosphate reductase|nr:ribonucleoside triphosphate reductase [Lachnospiraceae bacterium]MCI1657122.1 ribonucleoside triphosphate reductase [Lachnospiraceae bacterium]MCI2195661.1 ribonucleoside triphosphate reductase [Lachnospiraceae bacterium]
MFEVIKRNGETAAFDLQKISKALEKAFQAADKSYTQEMIQLLTLRVAADVQDRVQGDQIDVEMIQDSAERVLASAGYSDVAKIYILYRRQREKMRQMKSTFLDYRNIVNSYASEEHPDQEQKERKETVGSLMVSSAGAVTARYWLTEIYAGEAARAHQDGSFFIHDLSRLTPSTAGWSLKSLIREGLGGIPDTPDFGPARHLNVLCNQMVNFLYMVQNEWAGPQTFASFDTYLAPYVKADHLHYEQVRQCMESFVYGVNARGIWGTEPPFSNLVIDWKVPSDLADLPAEAGGRKMSFRYRDCQKEMDMINRALLEVLLAGDSAGRRFHYPNVTYSVTGEFDWADSRNSQLLFELTARYGTPFFSNYISSGRKKTEVRDQSGRRFLDPNRLQREAGSYFGSGENTGTIGKITVNLPRLAYQSADEQDFFQRLNHIMDLAAAALKTKRSVLMKFMQEDLYPCTGRYLGGFEGHFSAIGIMGMNEACLNASWIRKDLTQSRAQRFARSVLTHMRERLTRYQEKYGDLYSLEATQTEYLGIYLAGLDKEAYPDIVTSQTPEGKPYYTENSYLPENSFLDPEDELEIQDEFHVLYTSGTLFTARFRKEASDWKSVRNLVRRIAENFRMPYFRLLPADAAGDREYKPQAEQPKKAADFPLSHEEEHLNQLREKTEYPLETGVPSGEKKARTDHTLDEAPVAPAEEPQESPVPADAVDKEKDSERSGNPENQNGSEKYAGSESHAEPMRQEEPAGYAESAQKEEPGSYAEPVYCEEPESHAEAARQEETAGCAEPTRREAPKSCDGPEYHKNPERYGDPGKHKDSESWKDPENPGGAEPYRESETGETESQRKTGEEDSLPEAETDRPQAQTRSDVRQPEPEESGAGDSTAEKEPETSLQTRKDDRVEEAKKFMKDMKPAPRAAARTDGEGLPLEDGWYLFTLRNDPNCMVVRQLLGGRKYREIDTASNPKLRGAYQAFPVPVLLAVRGDRQERRTGVEEIQNYLAETEDNGSGPDA